MADATAITAAQMAYDNEKKESVPMWLLWWFTGVLGGHRFYLGDTGYALGMLFTLGGFGFWALIDAFMISGRRRNINSRKQQEIFQRYGLTPIAAPAQ
ncbi:TM2 domain-containing protein [Rothia halotolerans]|uniref:TM2 domain-containing protein n=1 Tax=Rothia halotolerans TaxID=405770 RepID=UPI00101BF0C9|nr:TM2 domain-containing protein [Rothia halotolerans]